MNEEVFDLGSFATPSIIGDSDGKIESKSPVRLPRNGTLANIKLTRASFDPSGLPSRRARFHRQSRYSSTVFAKGEATRISDQNFDNLLNVSSSEDR
jgi:hypothetical protein